MKKINTYFYISNLVSSQLSPLLMLMDWDVCSLVECTAVSLDQTANLLQFCNIAGLYGSLSQPWVSLSFHTPPLWKKTPHPYSKQQTGVVYESGSCSKVYISQMDRILDYGSSIGPWRLYRSRPFLHKWYILSNSSFFRGRWVQGL